MKKFLVTTLLFLIGGLSLTSQAGELSIYNCDISTDMTVEQFKKKFSVRKDPLDMYTEHNRPKNITDQQLMVINKKYYRFENYGMWVFFSMEGQLDTLRFEKPYRGTVGGVHIGDSMEELLKVKGMPESNDSNGIIYRSSGTYVNYKTMNGLVYQAFTNHCD